MKILVIDGNYLVYKSFFAFKNRHLTVEKDGIEITTSAIFGFVREIIKLTLEQKYNFIICAWDCPPYIKKIRVPSYKERPKKDIQSLSDEKIILIELLNDLKIPSIFSKGYEGEEVAASVIKKLEKYHVDLYSNDEDCYALLSQRTHLVNTKKRHKKDRKTSFVAFTTRDLKEKYKVTPKEFIQFKALTGCKSDKVDGVVGIGPVTASALINEFKTVKNIKNNIEKIKPKTA